LISAQECDIIFIEEWKEFKIKTNTVSDYFIESIRKRGDSKK